MRCFLLIVTLGLLPAAALRAEDDAAAAPAATTAVENCIGNETIELHAGTDSALLDAVDQAQVLAAMHARYAQLARDAFAPTAIVLWRKPSIGWVYVALNSHPDKPGKLCSAASFSAQAFDFTGTLLRKYFFAGRT